MLRHPLLHLYLVSSLAGCAGGAARSARQESALDATVTRCWPLHYDDQVPASFARPPHVRAASALVGTAERLFVFQDDTLFAGVFDPARGRVHTIPLPPDPEGHRVFDDAHGNRFRKFDYEAALAIRERIFAFGSGSTIDRDRVTVLADLSAQRPTATLVRATALYERLRATRSFAGYELNIEGVAKVGSFVRFFQRGNGAVRDGAPPKNATCDVVADELVRFLDGRGKVPSPRNVRHHELGTLDGVRLTFTDAFGWRDTTLFLAAAEASPNAVQDGPVSGTVLGVLDERGIRWAPLRRPSGERVRVKGEGLTVVSSQLAYVSTDVDDPGVPSDVCEVALRGY